MPSDNSKLEEAINFCLSKGFTEESRDEDRVVMVKKRALGRTKQLVLTTEADAVYYAGKSGRRRFPTSWFSRWLRGPDF